MESQSEEPETPVIPHVKCQRDEPTFNLECQYRLLNDMADACYERGDVPHAQTHEGKYLVAIQMTNEDTHESNLELFWTTPDQTVEDWILGRTMKGTHIQFEAPHVGPMTVALHERLHQVGDIFQCSFKELPRRVCRLQLITFMEEGVQIAQATVPFGTRICEIFNTHHWNGTYCTTDGMIIPPDQPIFEEQIVHLDDPNKPRDDPNESRQTMEILTLLKKLTINPMLKFTRFFKNRKKESNNSLNMEVLEMMKWLFTCAFLPPSDDPIMW